MAVGKELLELDLYGLLGIGEKATEKEVLVAPITEKGQTWRDIYLPGAGHLWMDTSSARVFNGGTVLRNFSASLAELPVFVKTS